MASRTRLTPIPLSEYGGARSGVRPARTIPPAPVIPPVVEPDPWPEGWHAADHLHPFDCTPADLDQED